MTVPADEALQRLRDGNARFASGRAQLDPGMRPVHAALSKGQAPFAVILGCADSRVPPELVFDQGPGELFVVRVAGNVADTTQLGSVEYAVEVLGVRLVVVLGHAGCGAVDATLDALCDPGDPPSRNLQSILARIKPGVRRVMRAAASAPRDQLLAAAVRANVEQTVADLRRGSEIVARRMDEDGLRIVGAEYALETGVAEFLDPARR